jgi:hypothetical protein
MALFNYHAVQVNTGVYSIERLGIARNVPLAHWDNQQQADNIARLLYLETSEMAQVARNEAVTDIRREFLKNVWLKIDLSALPHIAKAKSPGDVGISIALAEMTEALAEREALRARIRELEADAADARQASAIKDNKLAAAIVEIDAYRAALSPFADAVHDTDVATTDKRYVYRLGAEIEAEDRFCGIYLPNLRQWLEVKHLRHAAEVYAKYAPKGQDEDV